MRMSLADTHVLTNPGGKVARVQKTVQDLTPLGNDLASLVSTQPGRLEKLEEITTLRSPLQRRASYRLCFSDGTVIKGRRFKNIEKANQANALAPLLDGLPFNKVLSARGTGRLEQWVDGQVLTPDKTSARLATWAGDLLGSLHCIPYADSSKTYTPPPVLDWYLNGIRRNLDLIARLGLAEPPMVSQLLQLAIDSMPQSTSNGLIHTDFSAENIVVNSDGSPIVVDNEHLTLGALDYDLARCWYRWPMSTSQRKAFCQAYLRHRNPGQAQQGFRFWAIYVLCKSTHVRLKHRYSAQGLLDSLSQIAMGTDHQVWSQFHTA